MDEKTPPALRALVRMLKNHGDRVATWRPQFGPSYGDDVWDLVPLAGERLDLPTSIDPYCDVSILAAEDVAVSMGFVVLERPQALRDASGLTRWACE